MSKHIWRGLVLPECPARVYDVKRYAGLGIGANCTVVGDAACFPVKDAMRYLLELEYIMREVSTSCALDAIYDRHKKYRKAVAKMKANAKKKGKK